MWVFATTLLKSCFGASDINIFFEFHLIYIKMVFPNICISTASPSFQFSSLDITNKTSSALTAGAVLLI